VSGFRASEARSRNLPGIRQSQLAAQAHSPDNAPKLGMSPNMPYWLWIAAGAALMIAEVFLGSFFVFWAGLAAVLVGLVVLVAPELAMAMQITIWALLSGSLGVGWFRYIKPMSRDRTKAGLSREALIGQIGQVLRPPTGDSRGLIRFTVPILGSDEWQILSEDPLAIGDRAHVTDLSGNALIVRKM